MARRDFVEGVVEEIAIKCNDPIEFILALSSVGFTSKAEKKIAVRIWNKIHKDKQLPIPREG